ncbi:hypothetical protein [Mycobacteroides chelonae]|uniref:hypothetical protein n=1 Tax=Mycobacteroides chelonae TaxID=1774 RepID=UPI000993C54C|nr:hypothetical protein [Mycobacteroides chelonae]
MTAAERRIGALLTRALHPSTPAAEAQVCRAKLAKIAERGPVLVEAAPGLMIDIASITIGGEVR